jgi:hypothetical protein
MRRILACALALPFLAIASAEDKVPLKLDLPNPFFVGTPYSIHVANLEKPRPGKRPDRLVPAGTVLLSRDKPVTGSDTFLVIGELALLTDGDKNGVDGSFVGCGPGVQGRRPPPLQ